MTVKKNMPLQTSSSSEVHIIEFRRVGKGARLVLLALRDILKNAYKWKRISSRLGAELLQVIQTDADHQAGNRRLASSNLTLLQGFPFFKEDPSTPSLPVAPTVRINRKQGKCVVSLPAFLPAQAVPLMSMATHVTVVAAAAAIDFEKNFYQTFTGNSISLPVNIETAVSFGFEAPRGSALPIVVVVGIKLERIDNGISTTLDERSLVVAHVDMQHSDRWKNATAGRAAAQLNKAIV